MNIDGIPNRVMQHKRKLLSTKHVYRENIILLPVYKILDIGTLIYTTLVVSKTENERKCI